MESRIKIKATVPEMQAFFDQDSGVRFMKIQDSRYTDADFEAMSEEMYNKEKFTFFVIYRHGELKKQLSGTFTIAGLKKRFDQNKKKPDATGVEEKNRC